MLTQFVTILILVAVIGCILYGRRLIRTEKVDAVFGNPERSKGGTHWVIVGSSAILMLWLIIHGILQKVFIQNQQMNYAKSLKLMSHY